MNPIYICGVYIKGGIKIRNIGRTNHMMKMGYTLCNMWNGCVRDSISRTDINVGYK